MNKKIPLPPSTILDDKLFTSFLGKESPNELIIQGHNISEIGSMFKEGASLRRLDISFNSLVNFKGIDQFNRLRQLSAYCCRLNNIDHICGTPHLQTLLLQQNGLVDFSPSFKQLKQLRELRIDRNQLSCISNLGNCSSLRILDISFNSIESLVGISGLQSLEELRATNNNITSLQTLKSLPSLRELQVSYNQLTSLDGIQYLPLLQTLHAHNNKITSVKVPQTFFKQKSISKKDIDRNDSKASLVRAGSLKKANFSSILSAPSSTSVSAEATQDATVTVLGLQSLTELFLSHNLITSLDGFDSLGSKIEILDFENNNLNLNGDKDEQLKFITRLSALTQLNELRLTFDASSNLSGDITSALFEACPSMKSFNGQTLTGLTLAEINETARNNEITEQSESAVYGDDSDEETAYGKIENDEIELEKGPSMERRGSRSAKNILIIDDVSAMDLQFKDLLSTCKDTLSVMLTLADQTAIGDVSIIENTSVVEKVNKKRNLSTKINFDVNTTDTAANDSTLPVAEKAEKELNLSTQIDFDVNTTDLLNDSKALRKSFTFLSEYDEEVKEQRSRVRPESGAANRGISQVGQDPLPCPPAKRPDSKGDLRLFRIPPGAKDMLSGKVPDSRSRLGATVLAIKSSTRI